VFGWSAALPDPAENALAKKISAYWYSFAQYLCQLGVFYPPFFDRYGPFFRVLVPVS